VTKQAFTLKAKKSIQYIRSQIKSINRYKISVILGSGMGEVCKTVSIRKIIPYRNIPGFGVPSVSGHRGEMVLGTIKSVPVIILKGRVHYYEGMGMELVTYPVRILAALGINKLVITSAVGGISPQFKTGDLVLVKDHINMMGTNPLHGSQKYCPERIFIDPRKLYSKQLRKKIIKIASSLGIKMGQGIYCAVAGPSYETPAEIRAFKRMGAGLVGMSLVPEAMVAIQEKIQVLGITLVVNKAAGIEKQSLSHKEVLRNSQKAQKKLSSLLTEVLSHI